MPTQDELLLKLIYQEENAQVLSDARAALDKMTDAEKDLIKQQADATKSNKQQGISLTDLKSGFELVGMAAQGVGKVYNALVGDTMEYVGQVKDLALNLGLTTEETSKLMSVGQKFGVSNEQITSSLQMMVKRGMAPSLDGLGKLADQMMAIKDPVERAKQATEIFGRNWTALMPILEKGSAGIKAAADEADRFGKIVSQKTADAAEALEIKINTLNEKLDGMKTRIGSEIIPRLSDAADGFNYLTEGIGSADEYENKLTQSIALGSIALGENNDKVQMAEQVLQQYLLVKQQVAMTEQEHTLRLNMATLATSQSQQATTNQAAAVANSSSATKEYSNTLLYNVQKYQEQQAAAENAAKAEAIHRSSISESITANNNLAQSLKSATNAQATQILAQSQLDTLKKAFESGRISQEQYYKATDAIMLRYDLATPKSIAMADATRDISTAFLEGRIPLEDYITSTGKIPGIAADGKVQMSELVSAGIIPTNTAVLMQAQRVDNLKSSWDKVPREVTTRYTIEVSGQVPSGVSSGFEGIQEKNKGNGAAAGANFIVPPGYPNDSYPLHVSSGERVIVTPQNSVTNNWNINADQAGMALLLERQRMMNQAQFEARM